MYINDVISLLENSKYSYMGADGLSEFISDLGMLFETSNDSTSMSSFKNITSVPGIAKSCMVDESGNTVACDDNTHEYRNYFVQNISNINLNTKSEDIIEMLCCPISFNIMQDPVITPQGTTYDRTSIKEWLSNMGFDPITRLSLETSELRRNNFAKDVIDVYQHYKSENLDIRQQAISALKLTVLFHKYNNLVDEMPCDRIQRALSTALDQNNLGLVKYITKKLLELNNISTLLDTIEHLKTNHNDRKLREVIHSSVSKASSDKIESMDIKELLETCNMNDQVKSHLEKEVHFRECVSAIGDEFFQKLLEDQNFTKRNKDNVASFVAYVDSIAHDNFKSNIAKLINQHNYPSLAQLMKYDFFDIKTFEEYIERKANENNSSEDLNAYGVLAFSLEQYAKQILGAPVNNINAPGINQKYSTHNIGKDKTITTSTQSILYLINRLSDSVQDSIKTTYRHNVDAESVYFDRSCHNILSSLAKICFLDEGVYTFPFNEFIKYAVRNYLNSNLKWKLSLNLGKSVSDFEQHIEDIAIASGSVGNNLLFKDMSFFMTSSYLVNKFEKPQSIKPSAKVMTRAQIILKQLLKALPKSKDAIKLLFIKISGTDNFNKVQADLHKYIEQQAFSIPAKNLNYVKLVLDQLEINNDKMSGVTGVIAMSYFYDKFGNYYVKANHDLKIITELPYGNTLSEQYTHYLENLLDTKNLNRGQLVNNALREIYCKMEDILNSIEHNFQYTQRNTVDYELKKLEDLSLIEIQLRDVASKKNILLNDYSNAKSLITNSLEKTSKLLYGSDKVIERLSNLVKWSIKTTSSHKSKKHSDDSIGTVTSRDMTNHAKLSSELARNLDEQILKQAKADDRDPFKSTKNKNDK